MSNVTFSMADRVVIVTGAARGIGWSAGAAFVDAGATVYAVDIDPVVMDGAAGVRADLTRPEDVEALMSRVEAEQGRLDVLVNNAGGFGTQAGVETLTPGDWSRLVDVNLTSVFLVTRAAMPLLRRSPAGRVVNLGSLAGQTAGYRTSPAYAAAKAGVHQITRVMAHELAADGVTVNAVAPSAVLTDRIRAVRNDAERAATAASIPLGRYQSPEELAVWILFLASEEAGFMTGETVAVNGGRLMI